MPIIAWRANPSISGSAIVRIATRRDFVEQMVVADYDRARAERAAAGGDDRRARHLSSMFGSSLSKKRKKSRISATRDPDGVAALPREVTASSARSASALRSPASRRLVWYQGFCGSR